MSEVDNMLADAVRLLTEVSHLVDYLQTQATSEKNDGRTSAHSYARKTGDDAATGRRKRRSRAPCPPASACKLDHDEVVISQGKDHSYHKCGHKSNARSHQMSVKKRSAASTDEGPEEKRSRMESKSGEK